MVVLATQYREYMLPVESCQTTGRSSMAKVLAVFLFLCSLQAQESDQLRVATHLRYFMTSESPNQGIFLVGWSPINLMSNVPDNVNLILGIGYAHKKWSIENMIWKQWSLGGNSFSFDWRFIAKPTQSISLYLEGAPRLDKRAMYNFAVIDVRVTGPINLGFETENIHRIGKDTLGFGPRVSVPLPFKFLGAKPMIAISHQFRTLGPNITRLYAFLNWSF